MTNRYLLLARGQDLKDLCLTQLKVMALLEKRTELILVPLQMCPAAVKLRSREEGTKLWKPNPYPHIDPVSFPFAFFFL